MNLHEGLYIQTTVPVYNIIYIDACIDQIKLHPSAHLFWPISLASICSQIYQLEYIPTRLSEYTKDITVQLFHTTIFHIKNVPLVKVDREKYKDVVEIRREEAGSKFEQIARKYVCKYAIYRCIPLSHFLQILYRAIDVFIEGCMYLMRWVYIT